jgi:hypothetical protein
MWITYVTLRRTLMSKASFHRDRHAYVSGGIGVDVQLVLKVTILTLFKINRLTW